ncbi:sulfatase/phosphatase domain-containing protein [Sphingobacterium corticibacterium]|uniref:DUF4976 domain-containing protein n=1 Tax=Sphingobacterium corticibacterium TaxID=2484746 RepID=A0A4Q6XZC9_9SPHI|nr:sulfatase/phosphatase domain-containing protein [Sphingobacterium corticibacterium]RZF61966.1 DUF4976 domain-containing protein [Sphingobacterium corticibacterium]
MGIRYLIFLWFMTDILSKLREASYARMSDAQKKAWDTAYTVKNKAFYDLKPKGDDLTPWKYQRYMQDYHYYEAGGHGVPIHEDVYLDSLKLINYYSLNEWELFDLRRDPYEMRSVYNNPEYTAKRKMLEKELARLRKQLKVPPNQK